MEIDITRFVVLEDPSSYSASSAELGQDAGKITWRNAMRRPESDWLLENPAQLEAFRAYVKGFGAWEEGEIAGWTPAECNALFAQLVAGDMREGGIEYPMSEEDWEKYAAGAKEGRYSSNIYQGDDGRVYYYLGS